MDESLFSHKKKSIFEHLEPKTSFWLGFILAIVVFFIIGFFVLLGIFVSQLDEKVSVKSNEDTSSEDTSSFGLAAKGNNTSPSQPEAPVPIPTNVKVAAVTDADHIRGNVEAKVSIVEFSDIQCPFCARFHSTMKQVLSDYDGKVNWVYRHFPLEGLHSEARPAAQAAECAGEQGKFWEFVDTVFENQANLSSAYYSEVATTLGLDLGEFDTCKNSKKFDTLISQQISQAASAGGSGTPHSVIVSGSTSIPVRGAVPTAQLKAMIDPLLAE